MAPDDVCGLCDGLDGNSALAKFPHIASHHPTKFEKQLRVFRDGERGNVPDGLMHEVATELTADQIEVLVARIAAQAL